MKRIRFVITAGPTREFLDPVRFLSNPSTGKMGFAIASEVAKRGHEAILVSGPVALPTPKGVTRVDIVSARDMLRAVRAAKGDVLIASAAVADWRPAKYSPKKLKKSAMSGMLQLVRNPDVLKSVRGLRKIGFAAETGDAFHEAVRKCREKKLEFIVANDVTSPGSGFGTDTNRVMFVYPDGRMRRFPLMTKRRVARAIVDEVIGCGGLI